MSPIKLLCEAIAEKAYCISQTTDRIIDVHQNPEIKQIADCLIETQQEEIAQIQNLVICLSSLFSQEDPEEMEEMQCHSTDQSQSSKEYSD